jgi:asparagine synthase (glutamine-hydrolysing)
LHGSGLPRKANPESVHQFLERGLIDYSDRTFFEGVFQLPAAHCLSAEIGTTLTPKVRRYWTLSTEGRLQISTDEAIEEFRRRFESSVRLRLRSDVPVGACLSGGLDSSSVVCQARRVAPTQKLHTFSSCFEEPELDEREFISATVQATNGELHWIFPRKEEFWQTIDKILYHLDEPVPSTNVFAQWSVMAEARRNGTPVLLGGQGADEILCGYQKYRYFYLWHLLRNRDTRVFRESLLWFRNGTRSYWSWADAANYLPGAVRRSFSPVKRLCPAAFGEEFRPAPVNFGASGSLAERQKIDITCTSLPALLHYEDRNSMAHSIETRLPFLDYKLVEFAVSCPSFIKMKDGWSKWILRRALEGTLPEKVRLRKTKLGFDTPQTAWVKYGLQNGHRELWKSPELQMSRFLSPRKLAYEIEQFLRAKPTSLSAGVLFRAVSLELWARKFAVV